MRALPIAVLALMLAACSPPAAKKDEAPAIAAAPAAMMTPGEWKTTMTFTEMNVAGMPASVAKSMAIPPIVTTDCVTSGDIGDFVNRRAIREEAAGTQCTTNQMNVSGGRIEAESQCADGAGGMQTMKMVGNYAPARVEMDLDMTRTGAQAMTGKMRMVSERIGDCPAK